MTANQGENGPPGEHDALRFDEFAVPTYEDWRAAADASLKGAPFDKLLTTKTYEGFTLQPIYRAEDVAQVAHQRTLPGEPPYVRGSHASGYSITPWEIAQVLRYPTPQAFNDALREDMARGQTAVCLPLDTATCRGLDPDQAEAGQVGRDGVSVARLDDLAQALNGVSLEESPVYVQVGETGLPFMALLIAWMQQQGQSTQKLRGCIEIDPLGMLMVDGSLSLPLNVTYDEMAQLLKWGKDHAPMLDTIAVHSAPVHNGGASAVQELAVALATGVAYIRAMLDRGLDVDTVAPRMGFFFSLGSGFFMEIAKLRAARLLWSQVITAFGGNSQSQAMTLHARSAIFNKSLLDPYVNMLRTTVETFAGAIGGVESMAVAPFDAVAREADSFSRRIARNQQLILQDETHLTRLIDPAGGSWYVEYLTDALARSAWSLFQQIEGQGGILAALEAGLVQAQVEEVAAQRGENLGRRKDVMVGANKYANATETPLEKPGIDYAAIAAMRAAEVAANRKANAVPTQRTLEEAVEAAQSGATINQITVGLRGEGSDGPQITPLPQIRATQAFEDLRKVAWGYAARVGHPPRVFLANMGPVAQHKARADFSIGFFEVGGFEVISNNGFATAEQAADSALDSGAQAVVICSTDDTYPQLVPPIVEQLKAAIPEVVVILAGYPQDQIEAHEAAGIDAFIHIRANCYEMNLWLQQQIGIRE